MNERKLLIFFSNLFLGGASAITKSTLAKLNPSAGFIISNSRAPSTSLAILITNEDISKLKKRFVILRYWINYITIRYKKILKQTKVDIKYDEERDFQLKRLYFHYLVKRSDTMKKNQFKVKDVFGNIIGKNEISQDQINKLSFF